MKPPDTRHADPRAVRRDALATAVFDALAGIRDEYPAALAESGGWERRAFAAAVARVVAVARAELEQQRGMWDAA